MSLADTLAKKEKEKEKEKQFKVIDFAYQFKTGTSVIKAVNGIYTPKNAEEKAFLEHQVSKQRISFE